MKNIFQTYDILCSYRVPNHEVTKCLLNFLVSKKLTDNHVLTSILKTRLTTNGLPDPIKIIHLIGLIHQKEKENISISQTNERSHFGIYYTDYNIARKLANDALCNVNSKKDIADMKFLEPCAGIGIFVIAYLDAIIEKFNISNKTELQNIVDGIFCADIDGEAIDILYRLVPAYIKYRHNLDINIKKRNLYIGDLLFKVEEGRVIKNDPKQIFNIPVGFDMVLTNPPYKLLKANSNKYKKDDPRYKDSYDNIIDYIKKEKIYKYNEGTLNLYKLFVEEIVENYTHQKGIIGLLIPMTILNDQQSEKLRKRIFREFSTSTIYTIPEKNNFFPDISQAFCFFTVKKECDTKKIQIIKDVIDVGNTTNEPVIIEKCDIDLISDSFPIIIESESGMKILKKINKFNKVSNYPSLVNLRGELDLTLNKEFITEQNTGLPLVKGINISEFGYTQPDLYVKEEFLNKINGKKKYIAENRLVCQQISNIHSVKRLKFTIIPKNYVLGNSCNFIALEENLFTENSMSLYYLLGVLNSYLLDWRFKLTNSNNHISNYELFDLPLLKPTNKEKNEIEELAEELEKDYNIINLKKLNNKVFELYGLTENERNYIIKNYEQPEIVSPLKNSPKLELAYAI